ncbi:OmpA family protein [Pseudotabrizicola alkalilacus]|uniref:OmpA family protein n=1 Tax=Pseudotabrizicola alkalilacus TaxID=2305252 RepID=A0A411Z4E7_9RHOB|nr:OmpA family protein [Pseudotabrizicola alkalilacus]RGP37892.1 OmpA family protein [Pseudotabrizicola alkalilacus]
MKRLLSTTTVLSLALTPITPWPLMAQGFGDELTVAEDGSILMQDGSVLCSVPAGQVCNMDQITIQFLAGDAEQLKAAAAAALDAARTEAEAAVAADVADVANDEAAAAAALAAEEAAAAEAARAAEDAAAAEQAAIAEAAAAEAARAADQAAAAEAEAAQAAEAAAAAEAVAAEQASAEQAAAEQAAEAERVAAEEAAAAEAARVAEEAAAVETVAPEASAEPAAPEATAETAPEAEPAPAPAEAAPVAPETVAVPEPAAAPVDVPVVTEAENESLFQLLTAPDSTADANGDAGEPVSAIAAAIAAFGVQTGATPAEGAEAPVAQPVPDNVTVTTVTEDSTRSSAEEFTAAPTAVGENKKSGLSNLEKVGLLALGALVVGKVLSDGREVVENTGDRVVVRDPQGNFQVYKDDDTLLRRPGATVRTETFNDGSTRSTVDREDGVQVVTIRDASGRVLRRATYDDRGNEVVLIDDLVREEQIDISTLPRPRPDRVTISTNDSDAAMKAALAREEARALGRTFSLRQIREIPQVRDLAATIDVDNITFDSGSAVIRPTEARKLASIGRIIDDILLDNPGEVFLIEGHTDAVGSASYNLTLSDRRAESVALALTEYYGIPPENMVVQGYGESELRVDTQADERRNRRAVVRVITPLMRTAALR